MLRVSTEHMNVINLHLAMISQQFRPELVFVFLLFSYGRLCAFYLFYTAHSHVTIEKYAFRAKAK